MLDRVRAACEAAWEREKADCSGFVRAVGMLLHVPLAGDANAIVDHLRAGGPWQHLADGVSAAASAAAGQFVVAGLRGHEQREPSAHGHVVVVVAGPLAHGRYPSAYWGKLHSVGARFETVNHAWTEGDRDRVTYAGHMLA